MLNLRNLIGRYSLLVLVAALCFAGAQSTSADSHKGNAKSIFDGKTLEGWDGDPKFWKVEDGAITGQTTKDNKTKGNTFIIWKGGELADFELNLEFKIIGGNSGIQYRSFKLKGSDEWRIGGYQGDFEAGDTYSGIIYGEKFRGILSKRGDKTTLSLDDKGKLVKKVENFGDTKEIGKAVKKQQWNKFKIVAKGFHFTQWINGVKTTELIDNDEKSRKAKGLLALQLHAGPAMKVQFRNITVKHLHAGEKAPKGAKGAQGDDGKKKIVFVAGRRSHGHGSHEHRAGSMLLAKSLVENMAGYDAVVVTEGWPKDESVFNGADAVVIYCDGGGGHVANKHVDTFDKLMKKGVGLACIHYGVETIKGKPGDAFLRWMGGYFETNWSVNPHWDANFKKFPDHPVSSGVKPFTTRDEWYYHMRFQPKMANVTPILSDLPGPETLKRKDGAHSGNPAVRKAVLERKEPQHVGWAYQRGADYNNGRGFGFTGGHFHKNWKDDNFRKVVLNAIVWVANGKVPKDGVNSKTPTDAEMTANQDKVGKLKGTVFQFPKDIKALYSGAAIAPPTATTVVALKKSNVKPAFLSKMITSKTPGHAVDIEVDIKGKKDLVLVMDDGGDFTCDWANWVEPRLIDANGKEKKLTELKWKTGSTGWGNLQIGKNVGGGKLKVDGKDVAYGIGAHATSVIHYVLPANHSYVKFKAKGALDDGGTKQQGGNSTSVAFAVYTEANSIVALAKQQKKKKNTGGGGGYDAETSLSKLAVHEGLQAEIFAAEPDMLNPSNIDIDHRGRVWVAEIVNYRRHKNTRKEGDRILILEDTDGDGKVDKTKVFYQGRDIDSPHGVCVLATPDGKGTKVIVSAGDKVQLFTDKDGDDVYDEKVTLFSGISGTQHDHGIHAFVFGPDGRLYFNFGNAGRQLKDANGKPIVDQAGNEVNNKRQPYQEGMVFRCEMDGSKLETLGWNFRNNWMVTVDSYGGIWQSDNDDDGNRGVRINFVMEFGNYGYKDEITGAAWRSKRTNLEKEVPLRHWHLNDPGVVPNLLQTFAGSPTGITVYEGNLLPKVFQGQVIHCDAGAPNACRAYPAVKDGAGYKAEMLDLLQGGGDKWYRPADVSVAPDGSLIVADWYDPGVGGHNMRDLDRGRLFRLTPKGHKGYKVPKFDFSTVEGSITALKNPNYATRYVAWQSLNKSQGKAKAGLDKLAKDANPRYRARALWLLAAIKGNTEAAIATAAADASDDIRAMAIRIARRHNLDVIPLVTKLAKDKSALVRRECLVAIRFLDSAAANSLWADLAAQHDGKDRWYLEALGIGGDLHADARFAAWQKKVGKNWNTAGGKDIVWRMRTKAALPLLVKIIKSTPKEEHPRFIRAFDFHPKGKEKDEALLQILG